jgi:hypothetical protein
MSRCWRFTGQAPDIFDPGQRVHYEYFVCGNTPSFSTVEGSGSIYSGYKIPLIDGNPAVGGDTSFFIPGTEAVAEASSDAYTIGYQSLGRYQSLGSCTGCLKPSCWRFFGKEYIGNVAGPARDIELFGCGMRGYFNFGGLPGKIGEAVPVLDGIAFGFFSYQTGTQSASIVDSVVRTVPYSVGDCQSCTAKYDCINGDCVLQTQYGTPGKYNSLAECQKNCGVEDVKFNNISVPIFSKCDSDNQPVNVMQTVSVIAGTEASELLKYQQMAALQGKINCNLDAVAAVPSGWPIRPEHNRSQVIYQFAEINNEGVIIGSPKYPITVPHHMPDKPDTGLPIFHRGNWEIIFVLKDNSKITIHSLDEPNGMLMLNAIKPRIIPDYLVKAYLSKSCMVVTETPYKEIRVKNRLAKYYSTGALTEIPDWIKKW